MSKSKREIISVFALFLFFLISLMFLRVIFELSIEIQKILNILECANLVGLLIVATSMITIVTIFEELE